MQEAIPYRTSIPSAAGGQGPTRAVSGFGSQDGVSRLVGDNAVVVFGRRGCCMCHVVKRLLLSHGVNPTVLEVDEEKEATVIDELSQIDVANGGGQSGGGTETIQFPVVFLGGKLFGGLDKVMSTHISGELVPILKDAGALWL